MKVSFRQIEKEDLELLRNWRNDERTKKYSREYRLLNMVNQANWFERIANSKTDDMFLVLLEGEPVGICGLTHINWKDRSGEISYLLGKQTNPVLDVAVGIEAYEFIKNKCFREYNLHRLWGEAFSFNKGGVQLALKSGFKQDAILREAVFWDNKYWDSVILSILEDEYFTGK